MNKKLPLPDGYEWAKGYKWIMGKRTKLVYLIGKSEKELLSYDEYDADGDGIYFQDNPVMAAEYYYMSAHEAVAEYLRHGELNIYLWEIADGDIQNKSRLWLQFTHQEAMDNLRSKDLTP